jgi:hypothetical protein
MNVRNIINLSKIFLVVCLLSQVGCKQPEAGGSAACMPARFVVVEKVDDESAYVMDGKRHACYYVQDMCTEHAIMANVSCGLLEENK